MDIKRKSNSQIEIIIHLKNVLLCPLKFSHSTFILKLFILETKLAFIYIDTYIFFLHYCREYYSLALKCTRMFSR